MCACFNIKYKQDQRSALYFSGLFYFHSGLAANFWYNSREFQRVLNKIRLLQDMFTFKLRLRRLRGIQQVQNLPPHKMFLLFGKHLIPHNRNFKADKWCHSLKITYLSGTGITEWCKECDSSLNVEDFSHRKSQ